MKATKIKMKSGSEYSNDLVEIDKIYLEGCAEDGFYTKASVHDYVNENPNTIRVNILPYPFVIAAVSVNDEKYVRSAANGSTKDNLLSLPRV